MTDTGTVSEGAGGWLSLGTALDKAFTFDIKNVNVQDTCASLRRKFFWSLSELGARWL